MKIAVTGANGHVGVNLCQALLDQGHEVRALIHHHAGAIKSLPVTQIRGDILDPESLRSFLQKVDVVFHLAARITINGDPGGIVSGTNIDGTRNMLEIAADAGIKRFIHFSSIDAIRPDPSAPVIDEDSILVESDGFPYSRSKAAGERLVLEAAREKLDAVVVSPTAIIGPADSVPSLTGKAVIQLYQHQIPGLVPGGYNWVDVRDVAEGAMAACRHGLRGEKYLLSGSWCSLSDLSGMISRLTGVRTPRRVFPYWLAKLGLPFISGYSRMTGNVPLYTSESLKIIAGGNEHISHEKASRTFGYQPRDLENTIKDLLTWFVENGYLKNYAKTDVN